MSKLTIHQSGTLTEQGAENKVENILKADKLILIGVNARNGRTEIDMCAEGLCCIDVVSILLQNATVVISNEFLTSDNPKQEKLAKIMLANLSNMIEGWKKNAACLNCACNPS